MQKRNNKIDISNEIFEDSYEENESSLNEDELNDTNEGNLFKDESYYIEDDEVEIRRVHDKLVDLNDFHNYSVIELFDLHHGILKYEPGTITPEMFKNIMLSIFEDNSNMINRYENKLGDHVSLATSMDEKIGYLKDLADAFFDILKENGYRFEKSKDKNEKDKYHAYRSSAFTDEEIRKSILKCNSKDSVCPGLERLIDSTIDKFVFEEKPMKEKLSKSEMINLLRAANIAYEAHYSKSKFTRFIEFISGRTEVRKINYIKSTFVKMGFDEQKITSIIEGREKDIESEIFKSVTEFRVENNLEKENIIFTKQANKIIKNSIKNHELVDEILNDVSKENLNNVVSNENLMNNNELTDDMLDFNNEVNDLDIQNNLKEEFDEEAFASIEEAFKKEDENELDMIEENKDKVF